MFARRHERTVQVPHQRDEGPFHLGEPEGLSDVVQEFGHDLARHFGVGVGVDGLQDREVEALRVTDIAVVEQSVEIASSVESAAGRGVREAAHQIAVAITGLDVHRHRSIFPASHHCSADQQADNPPGAWSRLGSNTLPFGVVR
jgi:hypothetical protein